MQARSCSIACATLVFCCTQLNAIAATPRECPIRLTDVTESSGITFQHTDGGTGKRYIVESVVAGLALFDYDGDGLIDIYFLNGAPPKDDVGNARPQNSLYRNNGDWTFTDVSERARVADSGYGLGVTVGDFNNDGDPDLYLNNFGPNALYCNNGDGTFDDITSHAGVGCGRKVGAGTSFLDADADGDLDLYVANYVDFDYDRHIVRMVGPHQFHPGPADYPPMADSLYRNNGDGTFIDVSKASNIASVAGTGMGMVCLDYDADHDTDIFVCNDHLPNFLLQNDGSGRFTDVGLLAGVAYDGFGKANGSMGVDCGDYDNDGHLDLFMTDYSSEMPVLYRNLDGQFFEDATSVARISNGAFPHVTWGTGLVDFDNDGDRDIFIACGHFMDNIRFIDERTMVRVANILLLNEGSGRFVDVSGQCGSGLLPVEASKGAAFDDLDNDGDIDAVILNANGPPTIIRNESTTRHRWVAVRLRGLRANRDGVGANVRIQAGRRMQVAEVHSGRGYQGHYGTRLHFGLERTERVDEISVRWIGGEASQLSNVVSGKTTVVLE